MHILLLFTVEDFIKCSRGCSDFLSHFGQAHQEVLWRWYSLLKGKLCLSVIAFHIYFNKSSGKPKVCCKGNKQHSSVNELDELIGWSNFLLKWSNQQQSYRNKCFSIQTSRNLKLICQIFKIIHWFKSTCDWNTIIELFWLWLFFRMHSIQIKSWTAERVRFLPNTSFHDEKQRVYRCFVFKNLWSET